MSVVYSLLTYDFSKFWFGPFFLSYSHINRSNSLLSVHSTTLDSKFIVGAVISGALAHSHRCAKRELIAGTGGIEKCLLCFRHGLLF